MYSPYYAATDETKYEYTVYTGLMALAMNNVNSTKYSSYITRCRRFIKWLALPDGEVFDYATPVGQLYVGGGEAYGFLALPSALGLLAGA